MVLVHSHGGASGKSFDTQRGILSAQSFGADKLGCAAGRVSISPELSRQHFNVFDRRNRHFTAKHNVAANPTASALLTSLATG